jgi:hypothetical protein
MDLVTFERRAIELWTAIPARFREGVTAFVVEPGAYRKEEFEEGWCYGTCEPDEAVMAIPGAPVSSIVRVWYGSFVRIAEDDDDFDWEEELAETVRHELQHHLEWRAGEDHLGDEDDLQDENERRLTGAAFRPWFHRGGIPLGKGAWLADDTLFVEVDVPKADWPRLAETGVTHTWGGLRLSVPPLPGDLLADEPVYDPAAVEGLAEVDAVWPWEEVCLVLQRKRGWWPW